MTQLCVMPPCRIRGRHQAACDGSECPGCLPRTTEGAFACEACVQRAHGHLAALIETTPDARLVAAGLVRRGGGGSTGKPGSRPPLNPGATDALAEVQNTLTTLTRDIAETRGMTVPRSGHQLDPIVVTARWLGGQVEWLSHAADGVEPWCIGVFAEIAACAGRVRAVVNGPGERKYLGPCGALIVENYERTEAPGWVDESGTMRTCEGDVYARVRADGTTAETGTCRTCRGEVDTGKRRLWLDEQAARVDLVWTALNIADALGINVKTLRAWATERRAPNDVVLRRAKLSTYWRDGDRLVPWVEPRPGEDVKARGDRLHYVADVVILAREAAERRAAEAARKVREEVGVAS